MELGVGRGGGGRREVEGRRRLYKGHQHIHLYMCVFTVQALVCGIFALEERVPESDAVNVVCIIVIVVAG